MSQRDKNKLQDTARLDCVRTRRGKNPNLKAYLRLHNVDLPSFIHHLTVWQESNQHSVIRMGQCIQDVAVYARVHSDSNSYNCIQYYKLQTRLHLIIFLARKRASWPRNGTFNIERYHGRFVKTCKTASKQASVRIWTGSARNAQTDIICGIFD